MINLRGREEELHSSSPYPATHSYPFIMGRGHQSFQNWLKCGGMKVFARKRGRLRQNGGWGLSRNGWVAILYWGHAGDSSWYSIGKKYWCVYLSFVNRYMLKNNYLNKIDDWHCNSFHSVNSYNSCMNCSCKWQKLCFIILSHGIQGFLH